MFLLFRWRGRMQHILHGHYFHIIIVILVVIDAFIVLFELLLDVGAFSKPSMEISMETVPGSDLHR